MSKKNLAFKVITTLLVVIIIEVSLQTFYRILNGDFLNNRADLSIYEKNDYSCWKLKSNLNLNHKTGEFNYKINTDKNSFRNSGGSNVNNFNNTDGKKLMFLGPSFSFGWGSRYEKSYAGLISEYFKNKKFKKFINASIPGQLPNLQICWFINNGYKYQPDIIIQTIYGNIDFDMPKNIIEENFCNKVCELTNLKVTKKGFLVAGNKLFTNPKFYIKNSAIVFYSWYYFSAIRSNFFNKNNTIENSVQIQKSHNINLKKLEDSYKNYVDIIKKYSPNSKVIFIYIPYSFNIHNQDKARWSHKPIDLDQPLINYKAGINLISDKFNIVDTYPSLKKSSKENRMYYYVDTHFTESGNKVTFEKFKDFCNTTKCYN